MLLVSAQRICDGTGDGRNFKSVKITLLIAAVVTFAELLIPNDFEKVKYDLVKRFKLASEFLEDVKL